MGVLHEVFPSDIKEFIIVPQRNYTHSTYHNLMFGAPEIFLNYPYEIKKKIS